MALTRAEVAITWPTGAASITLSDANRHDSDAVLFDATDVAAAVQVSVDNQGTPARGDTVKVQIKWTTGDVLGDSGDDYDTDEHAAQLGVLDTYGTNDPGEDPARKSWDIPVGAKGFRLCVSSPNAATRNMVVRARMATQRAA